jgi:hypothetical protein
MPADDPRIPGEQPQTPLPEIDGDDVILSEATAAPGRMPPISAVTLSQHDLAAAYVLDALDADERIAFEEHLADCAICQEEVESLRKAVDFLPDALVAAPVDVPDAYPYLLRDVAHETLPVARLESPIASQDDEMTTNAVDANPSEPSPEDSEPITFPEGDGEALITPTGTSSPVVAEADESEDIDEETDDAATDAIAAGRPSRPPGRIRPGYRPPADSPEAALVKRPGLRASPAAVAALILAIAGVGIFLWALILQGRVNDLQGEADAQATQLAQIRLQSNATAYTLSPTADGPPTASGTFFFSLPDQRGALVARGLNSAPAGQTYQIWYLQTGSDPVAGPTFAVTAQGDAVVPLTANVVTFDGVAISLEPESGSDRPTTPLLLQGQLGGAAG